MVAQAGHWLLAEGPIDRLFEREAQQQYTRKIAFSSVVDAMSLIVLDGARSVPRAIERNKAQINASLTALYEKINHTEPHVAAALVTHVAQRAASLMRDCPRVNEPIVAGFEVRVVDGNQAATHRRLQPLRGSAAGPLPSMAPDASPDRMLENCWRVEHAMASSSAQERCWRTNADRFLKRWLEKSRCNGPRISSDPCPTCEASRRDTVKQSFITSI